MILARQYPTWSHPDPDGIGRSDSDSDNDSVKFTTEKQRKILAALDDTDWKALKEIHQSSGIPVTLIQSGLNTLLSKDLVQRMQEGYRWLWKKS